MDFFGLIPYLIFQPVFSGSEWLEMQSVSIRIDAYHDATQFGFWMGMMTVFN